jgi:hypothetical protein
MSEDNLVVLEATRVLYRSENDESAFFEWLSKLECVQKYEGRGDTLSIHVIRNKVDESALRELLALFYRYGVDMRQLAVFESGDFQPWFTNSQAYWFPSVFGNSSMSTS